MCSTRASKSLKSPVTPITTSTAGNDSVFLSPTTSSTMSLLPKGWSEKSLDDKMTALTDQFLTSELSTNRKLESLNQRITEMNNKQSNTTEKLTEITINVQVIAYSIFKLDEELTEMKTKMVTDK